MNVIFRQRSVILYASDCMSGNIHAYLLFLQGALDGGLDIPHSDKRFAGFSKDSKQLDVDVHRKYIYGGHVAAYMRVIVLLCDSDVLFLHSPPC